jgi:hypothetical protein
LLFEIFVGYCFTFNIVLINIRTLFKDKHRFSTVSLEKKEEDKKSFNLQNGFNYKKKCKEFDGVLC